MTKQDVTVSFGGKQVARQVNLFDSLEEAQQELGAVEMLRLINWGNKVRQMQAIRNELERHPRGSSEQR
jgi:hypothetical protein